MNDEEQPGAIEPTESSRLPYPPFELANRVLQLPSNDLPGFVAYELAGRELRDEMVKLLPAGTTLEGARILDFGCGAGRTMRHFLDEARSGELVGVDIDERSVDWVNENLNPPLKASVCGIDPPLELDDGTFDFAYAVSVFTHLSGNSAEWLLELHRVLRPGGLLMASYMGEWNSEAIAGEPWDPDRIGMNLLHHNRPWDDGGPMVLMSDWWVDEHWGRAFEIVNRNPWVYNQHWVMLRKKDVRLTAAELLAPSDDPREFRALRHNIAQLQREVDAATELGSAWGRRMHRRRSKLTAPLRRLRGR